MNFKGRQEERKSAEDTQEKENATIETQIHKLLLDFIFKLVPIRMTFFFFRTAEYFNLAFKAQGRAAALVQSVWAGFT